MATQNNQLKLADGVLQVSKLPKVFKWRDVKYKRDELTEEQIKMLAQDKAFPHLIEGKEEKKESQTPAAKA